MFLITSVNPGYIQFAKIFFSSIIKLRDYKKLKKIFVIDHGLSKEQKKYLLSKSSKICFINFFVPKIESSDVHSNRWRRIISYKTKIFLNLLCIGYQPLIYIDIDSYFNDDFLYLLNFQKADFIACKRSKTQINANGYKLDYIASFFAVTKYSQKINQFFKSWILNMENIEGPTKETPALCKTLKIYKKEINIKNVDEDTLSLYAPDCDLYKFNKCSIFHLKSSNSKDTISKRIKRLVDYGINNDLSKKTYLNLNLYSNLKLEFLTILNSSLVSLILFIRLKLKQFLIFSKSNTQSFNSY